MGAIAQPAPLTPAQRQRGLRTLLATTFFAWAGFMLVIPLVAVYYVDDLGWAVGTIGVMLAIRQVGQQGTAIGFGMLADKFGPKPLIVTGMMIRTAGFVTLGFADTIPMVTLSMLLAALGGALFDSPNAAALAAIVPPEDRQRTYALLGVIGGVGMVIGTQTGALLIQYDFRIVCLVSAAGYFLMSLVVAVALPRFAVSTVGSESTVGLRYVFRDRVFVRFVALLIGYWFAWTQLQLTMTLAVTDIAGTTKAVSWLYLVNTGFVIGFGFFLPTWLGRWFRSIDLLAAGTLLLGLGLAAVGVATNTPAVLVAVAIFSLGMVIARPGQETITANLSDPAQRGTYFGVAMLALAIGGGVGNLLGGVAYDFGKQHDLQALTWGGFFVVAAISAVGLFINREPFSAIRSEVVAEAEDVAVAPVSATATS